jgi:protein ImuB
MPAECLYACLHIAGPCGAEEEGLLMDLGLEFSPEVEQTSSSTIVFSILPLRKLIGSPHQIASEICRAGYERKLQANLAIASNPDAAILLARHFQGVTLVTPGEERLKLAPITLAQIFKLYSSDYFDKGLLEVLHRWGVKACEELAALPEKGVSERLGQPGVQLRNLARGAVQRPLRLCAVSTNYKQHVELEHALQLLEPLLFLLGRTLGELCGLLRSQSQAARLLELTLDLEDNPAYVATLEFPVALTDQRTILKLLQLHLERHAPAAAIKAFCVRLEPVTPRRVQGGIFLPPTPPPDKLQLTLARIAGMVGSANLGTPRLLNTHRPDAYELLPLPGCSIDAGNARRGGSGTSTQAKAPAPPGQNRCLRLAMRLFRPPLEARVQVAQQAPKRVVAMGVKGNVIEHAGPWKTAGEWWAATAWNREEWDVALDDGALYRIYQESNRGLWFVHGMYD